VGEEANGRAGHPRGFPSARKTPPKAFPWAALALRQCGNVQPDPGPTLPPPGSGPCARLGAPTTSSSTDWPRFAWICWTRRHAERTAIPRNDGTGTTMGEPCCNAHGACAPCPLRTVAPRLSFTSGYAYYGRRRTKCGGTVWPWARTPCHQCRPARRALTQRRQAHRPTQDEGRSPPEGTWSPTRDQANRRKAGSHDRSCP